MTLIELIWHTVIYSGFCLAAIWLERAYSIPVWVGVPILIAAFVQSWALLCVLLRGRHEEDPARDMEDLASMHEYVVSSISEYVSASEAFIPVRSPGMYFDSNATKACRHASVLVYVDGIERVQEEHVSGALDRVITLIRHADVLAEGDSLMERLAALRTLDLAIALVDLISTQRSDEPDPTADVRASLALFDPSDPVNLVEALDWEMQAVSDGLSNRSLPKHMRQPSGAPHLTAQLYETTMQDLRQAWLSPDRLDAIASVGIPSKIEELVPPLARIAIACERTCRGLEAVQRDSATG